MPRNIETTVYTIEEHPNAEKVYEWIRNNWYDLGEYCLQDMIESLESFAECIGASVNWSLSIHSDRGEYVRFNFGYDEQTLGDVMLNLDLSGNCPFTGMCYDETILDAFREVTNDASATLDDVLRNVEHSVLKTLHAEGDYLYSDEGLRDMCEVNEYEFDETGAIA